MRIKKGDYVQVISGSENGKRGRVLRVLPQKNLAIVEGINYIYRHLKKSQKTPQGGRVEKEAPLHISKIMLYCPHSQSPTRTCYRYEEAKDKAEGTPEKVKKVKIRYSKKSNRQI
jgi:large subunit ribosomal protein L24